MPTLGEAQRLAWLRLIRSENVGPRTFRDLVNHFGGAQAAIDALPELAARGGARKVRICSVAEAEREMEALTRLGGRFVAQGEADFPVALAAADGAPPLIAVIGGADVVRRPALGIVGARNASGAGRTFAERLARAAGEAGYGVVSGLARGIDAAAHSGSLATGTVAIYAGGLDKVYPPEHADLARRIVAAGGALASEMPLGWSPRARDFPRRNRIVAGFSHAVVVVEAALRSGSLITARFAADMGREVGAVPGSPLDPRAEGSNELLRDGATLIAKPDHLLQLLAGVHLPEPPPIVMAEPIAQDPDAPVPETDRARILELLSPVPTSIDDLVRHSGTEARTVQIVLLELDLAGRLERHAGGRVSLLP
jgi:DNA processing protein